MATQRDIIWEGAEKAQKAELRATRITFEKRPRCKYDNMLLDKDGKCWYCQRKEGE